MNAIAAEHAINAPFNKLKDLARNGEPVLVLGAFDAKDFDGRICGIAFAVTQELIDHIKSNMPGTSYNDDYELVGQYVDFNFDSRWLLANDANNSELGAPVLKLFGHENSFWFEEENNDESILIQSRQLSVEALEGILRGEPLNGHFQDAKSGLHFHSEYYLEANHICDNLKKYGFSVQ